MKAIVWSFEARRALQKLPTKARTEIQAKLARFAETGAGNVKRLSARPGARLRVGNYRVIFKETADTIEVRAAGDRRDIYD